MTLSNLRGYVQDERARLEKILKDRSIEIPEDVPIRCFGEYGELCVEREVQRLGLLLGKEASTPQKKVPELTLSYLDPGSYYGILQQKSKNNIEVRPR